MRQLNKLYFLIHGFCHACRQPDKQLQPYLARENVCAEAWYARLENLSADEALVIIPTGRDGPAAEFHAKAVSTLGDRCFMLDCPDCLQPEFWSSGGSGHDRSLLEEIESAFVHQRMMWNKEELHTALHCFSCYRQFRSMLTQRGYSFTPASVLTDAWGASFEGCVTKYTLNMGRMLGLSSPVGINFNMTVPDAFFLLEASIHDCILLDNGLRLFLFEHKGHIVGLFTFTTHSLAEKPAHVTLTVEPETITVRSKQGIRLWPQPEDYALATSPAGCHEPPQRVVKPVDDGLQIPISAGFVYRLAKAPAYLFMPSEMSYADARSILTSAKFP